MQNLLYALIQVIHNFGAVAIVGLATIGVWRVQASISSHRRLALWLAIAWAVQVAAGGAFGATSLYYYGHFPDIHGIAVAALGIKVVCAGLGFAIAALYWWRQAVGPLVHPRTVWGVSLALGATALTAAAFLRWFS
ncbi:MAG: hypothetical protein COX57_01670 [Alphaproteobacteria bacterium CG_4_10_14_0_2_um_filter_63_37]|nr:MAG: hypothetical protein AUJ55_12135 [Proteobacteria bacterium CG1_02_64_396]PJA25717.1 MAG: hypothetical protein COX57_01670 [Alphaproteobacteria bacterium CG_4_10_14_0_2_um_filter_63_37]